MRSFDLVKLSCKRLLANSHELLCNSQLCNSYANSHSTLVLASRSKNDTSFIRHAYLRISFKIVVQNIDTDGQIASVKWIGTIPSLRTKLSSFCHNGVEVTQRKQDTLELIFTGTHFQGVLVKHDEKAVKIHTVYLYRIA